jgi:hypothetical protein
MQSNRVPGILAKRLAIMTFLLGLSKKEMEAMQKDCIADFGEEAGEVFFLQQVEDLCREISDPFFFIEDGENGARGFSLALTLTKCPYSKIEYSVNNGGGKRYLYACADGFENVTIYELGTIFTLAERYLHDGDLDTLHTLLAVIYRHPKPDTLENKAAGYNGDIRRPLMHEESLVENRAKKWANVVDEVKQVILFWVLSCRDQIIRAYPVIFDPEYSQPKMAGEKDFGWGGLLLGIAKGPVHLEAVANQPYQNVFIWLSMLEDERKMAMLNRRL